jgi:hypothetical protein
MGRIFGGSMDFLLCCCISLSLLVASKRHILLGAFTLFLLALLVFILCIGGELSWKAFSESLAAINQTPGGVLFTGAVLIVLLIIHRQTKQKGLSIPGAFSIADLTQKLFAIVGLATVVAVGLWLVLFSYFLYIHVPVSTYRLARSVSVPRRIFPCPSPPFDWNIYPLSRQTIATPRVKASGHALGNLRARLIKLSNEILAKLRQSEDDASSVNNVGVPGLVFRSQFMDRVKAVRDDCAAINRDDELNSLLKTIEQLDKMRDDNVRRTGESEGYNPIPIPEIEHIAAGLKRLASAIQ